ncbi:hypothetical protein JCM8547_008590 [Rhodosporidiobolus lusitaniae]
MALALAVATATIAAPPCAAQDNSNNWTLSTTDFVRDHWQVQPYVANGYIGQRLPAEGFGYMQFEPVNQTAHNETQGWPLFTPRQAAAMVAGFYDQQPMTEGTNFDQTGGQQPISTLPTWSSLYLTVNNQTYSTLTPDSEISNYSQSLSIQDGVVVTELNWSPAGVSLNGTNSTATSALTVSYTVFAHRVLPNVGVVKLNVKGLSNDLAVAVTDVFDGAGAWRTDFVSSGSVPNNSAALHTAVRPYGISNVTAYEVSVLSLDATSTSLDEGANCLGTILSTNTSTASQCFRLLQVPESGELTAIKYVGIASSDAYPGAELDTALQAALSANETGYDSLLESHQQAWAAIWDDADIEIPGQENVELQLATRASLFHILSNVRNGTESTGLGDNSIAPAGLTSDSYAGQVFWDADTWMYPGLLALYPDYAESVVDFRYRQLGGAQQNARDRNYSFVNDSSPALYPWTGARFGNSTGVGPAYDYEYHLNSDIALAVYQYFAATGNHTWLAEKGWPIVKSVADMFAQFVVYNETTRTYDTYNETSPDEYSNHRNNSAMINGALSVTLRQAIELGALLGYEAPSNWSTIADNITMLSSPTGILLEFEGYNTQVPVKQADVVLLTYPFEYPLADTLELQNLDFYSQQNSASGPSMTYSMFSIIAAQLSPAGCASYSYFLQAAQPYSRLPYYQFSEQTNDVFASNNGTNPAFTFLTGHGGFLQTLAHGYTGYRSRLDRLYFDPNLPPQFGGYTVKGLKHQGTSFDVSVMATNTTITRRDDGRNETVAVEIAAGNAQAGNYTLASGETLTVPTRSTSGTLIPGNLAQCATVLSNDTSFSIPAGESTIVPGEFALAAVDGANATTWQPLTPEPATLTIDLGAEKTINSLHINWGTAPPLSYAVAVANASDSFTASNASFPVTTIASANISSSDLQAITAEESTTVAVRFGNTTDVALQQSAVARFVQLSIEGSWNSEGGYGATVAEFAVIGV